MVEDGHFGCVHENTRDWLAATLSERIDNK